MIILFLLAQLCSGKLYYLDKGTIADFLLHQAYLSTSILLTVNVDFSPSGINNGNKKFIKHTSINFNKDIKDNFYNSSEKVEFLHAKNEFNIFTMNHKELLIIIY